jgi:hypothetical protein
VTIVVASCPTCGQVQLPPEVVHLVLCTPRARSSYWFPCPGCREAIRKPADEHIISLLKGADVPVTLLAVPLEALEPHSGPPLTANDVLDALLELEQL